MFSNADRLVSPAAAVILVCFFLPWVLVSCEGQDLVEASGWDMASGGEVETAFGSEDIESTPELFMVPVAAIGALILIYVAYQGYINNQASAASTVGLALLSALIIYLKISDLFSRAQDAGLEVEFRYGFWGVVLAHIALVLGAAIKLVEGQGPASGASSRRRSRGTRSPSRSSRSQSPPRRRD